MSLCVYFPICTLGMGRETERERERMREREREGGSKRETEREGERREERSVISELINSLHIANDAHTEPWRPQRSMRAEQKKPFVWFLSKSHVEQWTTASCTPNRLHSELLTST